MIRCNANPNITLLQVKDQLLLQQVNLTSPTNWRRLVLVVKQHVTPKVHYI